LTKNFAHVPQRENAKKAPDARTLLELAPRVFVELRHFTDWHLRLLGQELDGSLVMGWRAVISVHGMGAARSAAVLGKVPSVASWRVRSVALGVDERVTLAGGRFEAFMVKDPDLAAVVIDQLSGLQRARRSGDADPPHPQHVRKKFVSQPELARPHPVAGHQQPTGKARDYDV